VRAPCGRVVPGDEVWPGNRCPYPRMSGKQRCMWHWLIDQPAQIQLEFAQKRREALDGPERARVPASEWPVGTRWCAGCQGFVPLFYCTGSRCKAHVSAAAHGSRIEREYGITEDDYDRLFKAQGGRCFICRRKPRTLRLAVDHDHVTGEVRGLLCANNENGCNRAVVANLEAATDSGLDAAKRAVLYLYYPPLRRLRDGVGLSWPGFIKQEAARLAQEAERRTSGTGAQDAPF
jgi:hypothetical protein